MNMRKHMLREQFDSNMNAFIRSYELENGKIQYTIQYIGAKPEKLVNLERPMHAHICISNRCNLTCSYCYANDGCINKDMSTEKILQVIDLCDKNGIFSITWTGGEPFCRDDLMLFLERANKKKIHQTVLTNGTCIPDGFLENCPHKNIFFQFSLNEAWNDNIENKLNHEKVFKNIRKCNFLGLSNILTIMLAVESEKNIENLIVRLIDNNVLLIRFGFLMPVGKVNREYYEKYIATIQNNIHIYNELREKYKDKITILYQFDKKQFSYRLSQKIFDV